MAKTCQGSVTSVKVNGVSKSFTFSTSNPSGVLNITGITTNYDVANGMSVCLTLQVDATVG